MAFRTTGELLRSKPHAERALELARRLGAKRFEATSLNDLAMAVSAESGAAEASALIRRALAVGREAGVSFIGPVALGHLAITTNDPAERRAALEEGADILRTGAVGHNHLWFFRYAIEASLDAQEWDAAESYSSALAAYTAPEPLPWSDFFVARGRALAACGRGEASPDLLHAVQRLCDEAGRLGLRVRLPEPAAAAAG
jgi:hypothetical protein